MKHYWQHFKEDKDRGLREGWHLALSWSSLPSSGWLHQLDDKEWLFYIYNSNKKTDIEFKGNSKRDAYLDKVINAITNELFMGEGGKLVVGKMCEVRDTKSDDWMKRRLITILPEKYKERFITEWENHPTHHSSWNYARPITKRTEPTIEECGQLVTYTWEEK